jgi:DNA-binding response OmpR family regulator
MMEDLRVMIIDDEREILKMISETLKATGYKNVKTYTNPLEGIKAYNGSNVDVVLLDIMMPEIDGIEALNRLKSKNSDVKVIMMTAYSTLDKVLKSHKIGADHYLLKPFKSLAEIDKKIKAIMETA